MQTSKKCLAGLLALVLSLSLTVPALAAPAVEEEDAAWQLYRMGLFQGTGADEEGFPVFDLERTPNRAQGVTMLVRLLGREKQALEGTWHTPFTDVPDWAAPYVGYAYEAGLTDGKSPTQFVPDSSLQPREYLTFVLRALGYDSRTDFSWETPWVLSDALGITQGEYGAETTAFDRGDVAWLSRKALSAVSKGTGQTLADRLAQQGYTDPASRCLWREDCVTSRKDNLFFSFAAEKDSPETYTKFRVTQATVNGLPCTLEGWETPEAVKKHCQKVSDKEEQTVALPGAFALVRLTFDEAKAKERATETVQAGGVTYPVLTFKLRCTGTLEDGTEVEELVVMDYYIDGYQGLF